MTITTQNLNQTIADIKTAIQAHLPESNPFQSQGKLNAFATGIATAIHGGYVYMDQVVNSLFLQGESDSFVDAYASFFGLTRLPASISSGNAVITGDMGSVLPQFTQFKNSKGDIFVLQSQKIISNYSIIAQAISYIGGVATIIFQNPHKLATGLTVNISGADENVFNGNFTINVVNANTITYNISDAPAYTGGDIVVSGAFAFLNMTSALGGSDKNLASGEKLTIISPIANINSTALVDYGQVSGGTAVETDINFKERIKDNAKLIGGSFSRGYITNLIANKFSGITKIFFSDANPSNGAFTIYFINGEDTSIIPAQSQLDAVRSFIIDNDIRPVDLNPDNVFVKAPTPKLINFTFASLNPNTATMKETIRLTLDEYFRRNANMGQDISLNTINGIIWQAVDLTSGEQVKNFELNQPNTNITLGAEEIAILGNII